ncbi:MAG: hypothetical protein HYW24_04695 [Candidatus Aenigmarchaeota archaeon]|nr:hypothetical protein [Candidatus Aenigmarchaeota archaeon]
MNRKFMVYFDTDIWEKLSTTFEENKEKFPEIWRIFRQQNEEKIDIYYSDLHTGELINEKLDLCLKKSNKKVGKTFTPVDVETSSDNKQKSDELKQLVGDGKDNDVLHLLTCFINDIDAFITYDIDILKNWVKIKKLFKKWGKKNFILASPKGYLRLQRFTSYGLILLGLIPLSLFFKFAVGLSFFEMLLGYGMSITFILWFDLLKNIFYFRMNTETQKATTNAFEFMKSFSPMYYVIYGVFTTLIILLASNEITSEPFSILWLFLTIFAFQIPTFFYTIYLLSKNYRRELIILFFVIGYALLSAMFGWTSAYVERDILKLSALPDLLVATYGTGILFLVFTKYLEKYEVF